MNGVKIFTVVSCSQMDGEDNEHALARAHKRDLLARAVIGGVTIASTIPLAGVFIGTANAAMTLVAATVTAAVAAPKLKNQIDAGAEWLREIRGGTSRKITEEGESSGKITDQMNLNHVDAAAVQGGNFVKSTLHHPIFNIGSPAGSSLSESYQKISFIGRGSFGEAWKIQPKNVNTSRMFIMIEISCNEQDVKAGKNEIEMLKRCRHESIVIYIEDFYEQSKLLMNKNGILQWRQSGKLH